RCPREVDPGAGRRQSEPRDVVGAAWCGDGVLGTGAGHELPQIADRRTDSRSDVDDKPAAAGAGSYQCVDGVVDIEEVACLATVAVDLGTRRVTQRMCECCDHSPVD